MTAPLISAIIPTFNRRALVTRAVDSVLKQTYRPLEVIVVDDGSVDGTAEALAPLASSGLIRYFHQPNRGVSAARNLGLKQARGQLLAFLDSDDYWEPEKCRLQARFMAERPALAFCQTEEVWMRSGRRVNPGLRHQKRDGWIFEPSLELCLISPSAVMMKPNLPAQVGGFDEDLPAAEDYDLWLRATSRFEVGLLKEHLVVRTGGRPDQLSAQPGLDRFRVWALLKLLLGDGLERPQQAQVYQTLSARAWRYGQGALKRGRAVEGAAYLGVAEKARNREPFCGRDLTTLKETPLA